MERADCTGTRLLSNWRNLGLWRDPWAQDLPFVNIQIKKMIKWASSLVIRSCGCVESSCSQSDWWMVSRDLNRRILFVKNGLWLTRDDYEHDWFMSHYRQMETEMTGEKIGSYATVTSKINTKSTFTSNLRKERNKFIQKSIFNKPEFVSINSSFMVRRKNVSNIFWLIGIQYLCSSHDMKCKNCRLWWPQSYFNHSRVCTIYTEAGELFPYNMQLHTSSAGLLRFDEDGIDNCWLKHVRWRRRSQSRLAM